MNDKYIILNPWPAGFCNVLMSYEIVFAIALATNRKIIIPPTNWCVLIDEKGAPKETWQDIWQIFDKDHAKKNIDLIDLLEFHEFKPFLNELTNSNSMYSWCGNYNLIPDVHVLPQLNDSNMCFYNSQNISNKKDFEKFTENRLIFDINLKEKYLIASGFGHYWYNVYFDGPLNRNFFKQKINNVFAFKKYYHDLANELTKKLGVYNAAHVRNPWQLIFDQYTDVVQYKDKPDIVLKQFKKLFDKNKPLYVSTDINVPNFFDVVKQEYELIFLDDFKLNLTPLEKIALDIIICTNADKFYGSYYSTFSKRINIMRGINNKQADDYMGFNKIVPKSLEIKKPMPWNYYGPYHWPWHNSSFHQWTMEKSTMKNILSIVKEFLFGKLLREIKYRKRLKELRKRDPFIYK